MRSSEDGTYAFPSLGEQDASSKPNFHGIIRSIEVLGYDVPLTWERKEDALHVTAEGIRTDKPVVFKVML